MAQLRIKQSGESLPDELYIIQNGIFNDKITKSISYGNTTPRIVDNVYGGNDFTSTARAYITISNINHSKFDLTKYKKYVITYGGKWVSTFSGGSARVSFFINDLRSFDKSIGSSQRSMELSTYENTNIQALLTKIEIRLESGSVAQAMFGGIKEIKLVK